MSYQRNYEDNQEDQDEVAFLYQTVNLETDEIIDTLLVTLHGFRFEKEQIWERGDQRQQPSGDDKSKWLPWLHHNINLSLSVLTIL